MYITDCYRENWMKDKFITIFPLFLEWKFPYFIIFKTEIEQIIIYKEVELKKNFLAVFRGRKQKFMITLLNFILFSLNLKWFYSIYNNEN